MSTEPSREELPLPDWNDIPLGTSASAPWTRTASPPC